MRVRTLRNPVSALIALVVVLALAGTAGVAAQDTSSPPPDLSGVIAQGTCDAPGQVIHQVGDFIRIDESSVVGSTDIAFTLRAQRDIDGTLDALFAQTQYVFLVIDNTDSGGDPVACGALGGVNVNGQITIALMAPDSTDADRDRIVGVAIFGATTPTGPTTQPASQPGQLPVQAYLSEDALTPPETPVPTAPETTVPPTPTPTVAPSSPVPTMMPTMAPTWTATATETATATATETETATATATETATATSTATEDPEDEEDPT